MSHSEYPHLLQIQSSTKKIEANVVYAEQIEQGKMLVLGTYFGYCGGGAFQDGYFLLTEELKIFYSSDRNDFKSEYQNLFDQLIDYRVRFEDWEEEGALSDEAKREIGAEKPNKKDKSQLIISGDFDMDLLPIISSGWGLSVSWKEI